MVAWIKRFSSIKSKGELSVVEVDNAELLLLKVVQREVFPENIRTIEGLIGETYDNILCHVKTRLMNSDESNDFCFPVLLPASHPLTTSQSESSCRDPISYEQTSRKIFGYYKEDMLLKEELESASDVHGIVLTCSKQWEWI